VKRPVIAAKGKAKAEGKENDEGEKTTKGKGKATKAGTLKPKGEVKPWDLGARQIEEEHSSDEEPTMSNRDNQMFLERYVCLTVCATTYYLQYFPTNTTV
jgi:hypothetical protein